MSIEAIRSAFMAAGKGVVHLTHAGLAYKDSHQVLTFAGWHALRHAIRDGGGALRRSLYFNGAPSPTPASSGLSGS